MSSMFKKKGGLAFKPKAPVARARPSAPTAAKPTPTPAPAPAPQSAIEVPPETTLEIQTQIQTQAEAEAEAEATEKEAPTRPVRRRDSQATVGEEPKEKQKESPAESQRTTRRASHSQHSDTAPAPPIPPTGTANEATQGDEATELDTVAVVSAKVAPQPEATTPGSRTRRQSTAKPKPPSRASIETSTDKSTPSTEEATAPKPTESLDQSQNAPPADSAEEPAVISAPEPAPKRATRKPSATAAGNATPDGEAVQGESSRPRKRQRRTTQRGNGESRTPATRKRKTSGPNANASRSSSRRARSITPDDAETQLVDLQKLKMSDLTKDLRIGKKFSRHDELRERERERKARSKAKLEKDGETPSEAGDDSTNNNDKTSQLPAPDGTRAKSSTSTGGASASNPAATSGPQFRIVDGQIVVDQDSLVMDRHARAAAAQAGEDMETVEENDFTHLITSSSFMNTSKLKGPNIWTEPETELFYRGLRMFGTEFEMISKMFPGKQRRHVKLKFNREERHNPERIDAAVMGEKTIKMDIDEYRAFTGAEFESVEAIEAEQRKIQEGYEAERQRVADEQAEIMMKKREELFADDDDQGGAGKKKKKGKRKGKQAVSYGLNGEPIAQEG